MTKAMSAKEERKAAIAAAKAPVQSWLDARDQLVAQLAAHDKAGADYIGALVKVAEANGPFRFAQGRLNFRKVKDSNPAEYSVHADKDTPEM